MPADELARSAEWGVAWLFLAKYVLAPLLVSLLTLLAAWLLGMGK